MAVAAVEKMAAVVSRSAKNCKSCKNHKFQRPKIRKFLHILHFHYAFLAIRVQIWRIVRLHSRQCWQGAAAAKIAKKSRFKPQVISGGSRGGLLLLIFRSKSAAMAKVGFVAKCTPNPGPHQLPSQAHSLIARSNKGREKKHN